MENQDNSGVTASGEVRKFDFEQFVAYGREKVQAPEDTMPWSFDFYGWAVTHENNDRYILSKGSRSINFLRGDTLEVHPDGNVVNTAAPAIGIHDVAIAAEQTAATETTIKSSESPAPSPITAEQSVETKVAAQEITHVEATQQLSAMEAEGGAQPVTPPPAPVSHSEHESLKEKLATMEAENTRLKEEKAAAEKKAKEAPKPKAETNTKTDKPKANQPR